MDHQGFLKLLLGGKLGYRGANPINGNQGLGRIHICGVGMVNHTSLKVAQSFKISLKPHRYTKKNNTRNN